MRVVTLCGASAEIVFDAIRNGQDILEPKLVDRGIDIRPVDLGDWSVRGVPALLRAIRAERPDLILMQYPTGAFGRSLGPLLTGLLQRSAPMVVIQHEFVAAHVLRKLATGILLFRARRIGTTAEREQRAIERWYPWLRGRFRRIPIASNIPPRDWAPASPPIVVFFGQIRPEKGLEEFFAIHDRVTSRMAGVRFQVIGSTMPAFAEYGARAIDLALQRGIDVVQNLGSADVADRLAAATAAVLPFPDGCSFRRSSLFGVAACGMPIVTNIGPDTPDEILPFIDAAANLDEMTDLLERYLTDKASGLAAHAKTLAFRDYLGWDAIADRYIAVFDEIVGLPGAERGRVAAGGNVAR